MRDLAERNIAQMRETYERSKDALEGVVQSWGQSFDPTNQGAVALNRKIIDIAQRNINSGFDLAKGLAVRRTWLRPWNCRRTIGANSCKTLAAEAKEMKHSPLR